MCPGKIRIGDGQQTGTQEMIEENSLVSFRCRGQHCHFMLLGFLIVDVKYQVSALNVSAEF